MHQYQVSVRCTSRTYANFSGAGQWSGLVCREAMIMMDSVIRAETGLSCRSCWMAFKPLRSQDEASTSMAPTSQGCIGPSAAAIRRQTSATVAQCSAGAATQTLDPYGTLHTCRTTQQARYALLSVMSTVYGKQNAQKL